MRLRNHPIRLAAIAALMLLTAAACGDDDDAGSPGSSTTTAAEAPDTQGPLPSWLDRVYPEDGAEAAERAVEVDYGLLGPRQEIRVVIDGTDITAQMSGIDRASDGKTVFPSPGQLRYDPHEIARPLVELDPGRHDVTARLVELDEFGGNLQDVDQYAWTFTIQ
jgi:hypothetical protein